MNEMVVTEQLDRFEELISQFIRRHAQDPALHHPEVPRSQEQALRFLHCHPQVKAVDLARHLGLTPGTITGVLDDLELRGLLLRERSLEDRRIIWLRLSEAGHTLLADLQQRRRHRYGEMLQALGPEDAEALIDLVSKMLQFLQRIE